MSIEESSDAAEYKAQQNPHEILPAKLNHEEAIAAIAKLKAEIEKYPDQKNADQIEEYKLLTIELKIRALELGLGIESPPLILQNTHNQTENKSTKRTEPRPEPIGNLHETNGHVCSRIAHGIITLINLALVILFFIASGMVATGIKDIENNMIADWEYTQLCEAHGCKPGGYDKFVENIPTSYNAAFALCIAHSIFALFVIVRVLDFWFCKNALSIFRLFQIGVGFVSGFAIFVIIFVFIIYAGEAAYINDSVKIGERILILFLAIIPGTFIFFLVDLKCCCNCSCGYCTQLFDK